MVDPEPTTEGIELQGLIMRTVRENPEWRRYLGAMVQWEETHELREPYEGWEWEDVHTKTSVINALIDLGLVNCVSKSRAYRHYRLASLEQTRAALVNSEVRPKPIADINVEKLFNLVVGHDRIKQLIRFAVKAEAPVHCLLLGPPGTAKTLILSDVGNLPGAEFYVGSTTTKSGLVGLLLQCRPRYLVIDELDKMDDRDMSPLLNLMETGMVTRLMHGVDERTTLQTKVFAGANDARRISAPILSRFARFEIPPYTSEQFVDVARQVLIQREGLGPQSALLVANEVVKYSTDIRDAVRVARMAAKDPRLVPEIVTCLWSPDRRGYPFNR